MDTWRVEDFRLLKERLEEVRYLAVRCIGTRRRLLSGRNGTQRLQSIYEESGGFDKMARPLLFGLHVAPNTSHYPTRGSI